MPTRSPEACQSERAAESCCAALDRLLDIERERKLWPHELVEKARLIQIAPPRDALGLKDAEEAYRQALEIDDEYVPALVELAYYYWAVEDNAQAARPYFERAVSLCRSQLSEAASGVAGCLEELDSEEEARRYLRRIAAGREVREVESLLPDHQQWLAEESMDSGAAPED